VKQDDTRERPKGDEPIPADDAVGDYVDVAAVFSSVIPVLGGAISNVLSGWSQQRRMDRIREVLEGLQSRLLALEARVDKEYVRGEEFEDLLDQTLRRVSHERHEEKRRLYREFLLDATTKRDVPYDEQLRMIRVLDELQVAHIKVLRAVMQEPRPTPGPVSVTWLPALTGRLSGMSEELIEELFEQLKDLKVLKREETRIRMARSAEEAGRVVTRFGHRLVDFIRRI